MQQRLKQDVKAVIFKHQNTIMEVKQGIGSGVNEWTQLLTLTQIDWVHFMTWTL